MKRAGILASLIAIAAIYLYDPPWIGGVTSGLGRWQTDRDGMTFRWTLGHASFFVPRDATQMTLAVRAPFLENGGAPVTVQVAVDERHLADVVLSDPHTWVRSALPLPRRPARRHFRRIDLRIYPVVAPEGRGIQLGQIELAR